MGRFHFLWVGSLGDKGDSGNRGGSPFLGSLSPLIVGGGPLAALPVAWELTVPRAIGQSAARLLPAVAGSPAPSALSRPGAALRLAPGALRHSVQLSCLSFWVPCPPPPTPAAPLLHFPAPVSLPTMFVSGGPPPVLTTGRIHFSSLLYYRFSGVTEGEIANMCGP